MGIQGVNSWNFFSCWTESVAGLGVTFWNFLLPMPPWFLFLSQTQLLFLSFPFSKWVWDFSDVFEIIVASDCSLSYSIRLVRQLGLIVFSVLFSIYFIHFYQFIKYFRLNYYIDIIQNIVDLVRKSLEAILAHLCKHRPVYKKRFFR